MKKYYEKNKVHIRRQQANYRQTSSWKQSHQKSYFLNPTQWRPVDIELLREARRRSNAKRRALKRQNTTSTKFVKDYRLVLNQDPCCYCGNRCEQIDHINPIVLRGEDSWDNLTAACGKCNRRKGDTPLLLFLNKSRNNLITYT